MVAHGAAAVIAAVKAHVWRVWPLRRRMNLADLPEAHDLGPEPVRFLHVAHVQDQMIEADRRDGLTQGRIVGLVSHVNTPLE